MTDDVRERSETRDGSIVVARKKRQTNVRSLIILVACCAAFLWAGRYLWENYDAVSVSRRTIESTAIRDLSSSDQRTKLDALRNLQQLYMRGQKPSAVLPLVAALQDADPEVRASAAETLESMGSILAVSPTAGEGVRVALKGLIQALSDPKFEVRYAALQSIGSIDSRMNPANGEKAVVVESLTAVARFLDDPEPRLRALAVQAIGRVASTREAFAGTSVIGRDEWLAKIAKGQTDPDAKVRLAWIRALSTRDPIGLPPSELLLECLNDKDPENRRGVLDGVVGASLGLDPWVSPLLQKLGHDPDRQVRDQCADLLRTFHPPAITSAIVPVLIEGLESTVPGVRSASVHLLSFFKSEALDAVPQLLKILNEPIDPEVKFTYSEKGIFDPGCQAASTLETITRATPLEQDVIDALLKVVQNGPEQRRSWVAMELGGFGAKAERAVPTLMALFKSNEIKDFYSLGSSSLRALGQIAPGTASEDLVFEAIRTWIGSTDRFEKITGFEVLTNFGPRAIPVLTPFKNDRLIRIRQAANEMIQVIERRSKANSPSPSPDAKPSLAS